jgi:hypothetical protein
VLRNSFGKNANCFRVFETEALNRQRGGIRSGTRWSHHRWSWPGARPRLGGEAGPWSPLRLIFDLREASVKIGGLAFISSNSENISCVTFLKHKNSRK